MNSRKRAVGSFLFLVSSLFALGPVLSEETPQNMGAAPTFKALHIMFGDGPFVSAVSLGDFSPEGPIASTLKPVNAKLQQIEMDPKTNTYFGLTLHEVGTVNGETGDFKELEIDKALGKISWPKGLAFSNQDRRLWICSATGAGGFLYSLDVAKNEWHMQELGQITRLLEIAFDEKNGVLYGFPENLGSDSVEYLNQINANGAVVGRLELSKPLPLYLRLEPIVQMSVSEGAAFVLISYGASHPRLHRHQLYKIRLNNGDLELMPYEQQVNLVEKLWPGMPAGPRSSVEIPDATVEGPYSNYKTPAELISNQPKELHVISVNRGNVTSMQELMRHIKMLKIDSSGIQMELSLEEKPSSVEVHIQASQKPIVLALAAYDPVIWTVVPERGSQIDRVILLGRKGQKILGLPKNVETADQATGEPFGGGQTIYAEAWELERDLDGHFDRLIKKIREFSGLREASFQGARAGKNFKVPFKE